MEKFEKSIISLKEFATKLGRWPKITEWDAYAKDNELSHSKTIRNRWEKSWNTIGEELGFLIVRKEREKKTSSETRIELDLEEVLSLYNEGWYLHEIGQKLNCSGTTISKRLKEMGIDVSSRKRREITQERIDIPNDEIIRLYLDEGLSSREIAKLFNSSKTLILRRLKELNIEPRKNKDYSHVDKAFLIEYYERKRLSAREIAKIAGCNYRLILKRLKKYNIPVRTKMSDYTDSERKEKYGRKKEQHGLWKGGVTPIKNLVRNRLTYLSQKVFIRDKFTCKICGFKGGELHAHHIRPFAEIIDEIIEENEIKDFQSEEVRFSFVEVCEKDKRLLDLDNLITLCEQCHKNVHRDNPVEVVLFDNLEKERREFVKKNHFHMSVSEIGKELGIRPYRIIRYMKSNDLSFAFENEKWLREKLETKRFSEIAKEFNSRQFPCKSEDIRTAAINLGIVKDPTKHIIYLFDKEKMAIKTIAKKIIVSPGYVKDVLVRSGFYLSEREDIENAEKQICSMFESGETIEGIVKKLELPRNGVRRILLRNGFDTSSNRMVRYLND